MGARTDKRKQEKEKDFASKQLFNLVALYVKEIEGKNKRESKELFDSYELRWKLFVRKENERKGSNVKLNLQGFKNVVSKRKATYQLKVQLWSKHPNWFVRTWRSLFRKPAAV